MNARACVALAALLLGSVSPVGTASAEQLQRLHVTSLALTTDVLRPDAGQTFHLIIALHVREPGLRSQTVQLPSFNGLEELGDERTSVSGPRGTDYRETLTVVAPAGGAFHVSPASFDAIDAADGRPKRFISNALTIVVGRTVNRAVAMSAARALLVLAAALALPVLAWYFFAHRGARTETVRPEAVAEVQPMQPVDCDLSVAVLALRERRDRPSVLLVRSALWRAAGALTGETLADIVQRRAALSARKRALLMGAERAAFVQDEHLPEAISQLIAETEAEA